MTRELLAQVLQALAPEDQVSRAKWFVKGSNVTRRNRVRFVISGEEGARSESEEDIAEKLMDMCDTLYGKLSGKFAHVHEDVENKSKEAFLKSMVRMTEEALLILLRHRFPAF